MSTASAHRRLTPAQMIAMLSLAFTGPTAAPPALDANRRPVYMVEGGGQAMCAVQSIAQVNPEIFRQVASVGVHVPIAQLVNQGIRLSELFEHDGGTPWCLESHQIDFLQALQNAHDEAAQVYVRALDIQNVSEALARELFAAAMAERLEIVRVRFSIPDSDVRAAKPGMAATRAATNPTPEPEPAPEPVLIAVPDGMFRAVGIASNGERQNVLMDADAMQLVTVIGRPTNQVKVIFLDLAADDKLMELYVEGTTDDFIQAYMSARTEPLDTVMIPAMPKLDQPPASPTGRTRSGLEALLGALTALEMASLPGRHLHTGGYVSPRAG